MVACFPPPLLVQAALKLAPCLRLRFVLKSWPATPNACYRLFVPRDAVWSLPPEPPSFDGMTAEEPEAQADIVRASLEAFNRQLGRLAGTMRSGWWMNGKVEVKVVRRAQAVSGMCGAPAGSQRRTVEAVGSGPKRHGYARAPSNRYRGESGGSRRRRIRPLYTLLMGLDNPLSEMRYGFKCLCPSWRKLA